MHGQIKAIDQNQFGRVHFDQQPDDLNASLHIIELSDVKGFEIVIFGYQLYAFELYVHYAY